MALDVAAFTHVNGIDSSALSLNEEEDLYDDLLKLKDAVTQGRHQKIKLPATAIEQLRAALVLPESSDVDQQVARRVHDVAVVALQNSANTQQQSVNGSAAAMSIPGLFPSNPTSNSVPQAAGAKPSNYTGLDPIFLQKADSVVRAEGYLRRQRIEREIHEQVEKRKHVSFREKELQADIASHIDVDAIFAQAHALVKHISGLKVASPIASKVSSFDENDYYSSQVESEWSPGSALGGSSGRVGTAFTADFVTLDESSMAQSVPVPADSRRVKASFSRRASRLQEHEMPSTSQANPAGAVLTHNDEEDEYIPPEPIAGSHEHVSIVPPLPITSPDEDEEDSEYEPGEISQESVVVTPAYQAQPIRAEQHVPIIRNHLTHIAAPQPNRVSPLAVQKGPNIELELVNGRPEVVHKTQSRPALAQAYPSSASPSGVGAGQHGKKKKPKKRKRELDTQGRSKRRRERQSGQDSQTPYNQEIYIKDEPVSPPPFTSYPESSELLHRYGQPMQAHINLVSPRRVVHAAHAFEAAPAPLSSLHYDPHPLPSSPGMPRPASTANPRYVQRDTQDLRKVASLHHAQRPTSPEIRSYSPIAPYRSASRVYAEPQSQVHAHNLRDPRYQDLSGGTSIQYVRAESPASPLRLQEYRPVDRMESPGYMPPPAPGPGHIVVDQHGNRYYAAEAAPTSVRASVAPVSRRPETEVAYDRAPSRLSSHYAPSQSIQYEPMDVRTAPPPRQQQLMQSYPTEYVDSRGYRVREYSTRPVDTTRYTEVSTAPLYQRSVRYEQAPSLSLSDQARPSQYPDMAPPTAPPEARREGNYPQMAPPPPPPSQGREPTSPMYAAPRAYSMRPTYPQSTPMTYVPRQGSVAPVQYIPHEAPPPPPVRAVSVLPTPKLMGHEQDPRTYGYVAQPGVAYAEDSGQGLQSRQARSGEHYRY